jgi:hypothetical protein
MFNEGRASGKTASIVRVPFCAANKVELRSRRMRGLHYGRFGYPLISFRSELKNISMLYSTNSREKYALVAIFFTGCAYIHPPH